MVDFADKIRYGINEVAMSNRGVDVMLKSAQHFFYGSIYFVLKIFLVGEFKDLFYDSIRPFCVFRIRHS